MTTATRNDRATSPEAWAELCRAVDSDCRSLLRPPPRLTLSEWADRSRILSREASAEPGPWRTDRAPYLRGIMDAITDPFIRRVVWLASSQVGKTEVILNTIGYFIDQDPAPMLVVEPTLPTADALSKDRLAPMLRDSPPLAGKVRDVRSRDSGNTILHKTFPGGHITLVGANSPAGLSMRPIRVVLMDEVDRYDDSAGTEGSPVNLAEQRARTFWNRVVVLCSSPRLKGGRMDREFARSDRRRYYVPCPHCGHMQTLKWGGANDPFGLKWETAETQGGTTHNFETAAYLCESCGALIEESEKPDMLRAGEWRPENPESELRGFHINALYSPWARWAELASEFVAAKRGGKEELQTFVNLQLGEPWEEADDDFDPRSLEARRETYVADVPAGVGLLTAAVDVQDDRLELAVKGWGAGEESWLIRHERIWGDPDKDEVWARLEAALAGAWSHEAGGELRIRVCMIDSGGHFTHRVYDFVRGRERRGIYAIKGASSRTAELLKRATRKNRQGVKLWSVNTTQMKDLLFHRLRLQRPGPGYMHFRYQDSLGADAEYFAQFGGERPEKVREGRRIVRVYKQTRANEAIDLEVYNLAALFALGPKTRDRLGELAATAGQQHEPEPEPEPAAKAPRRTGHGKRRRGGFVGNW